MSTRGWQARVEDILEAINDVQQFTSDLSLEEFTQDTKTIYAVSFAIGVIGEASRAIPAEIKSQRLDIPWEKMQSMRNVILHEYFRVDLSILWDTATANLPSLVQPLQQMLIHADDDELSRGPDS